MPKKDIDLKEATRKANEYAREVKEPAEQGEKEENIEKFNKIIKTEKELLKIFHPKRLQLKVIYLKSLGSCWVCSV